MTWQRLISFARRFRRSEDGASLIEYSIVISLFLLVFFAILDFGRLGFNWVMTEKAMQRAARIAVARPPVCPGVPETHDRGTRVSARYGDLCRAGDNICMPEPAQVCRLSTSTMLSAMTDYQTDCPAATNADTATEIWCIIWPILPSNATPANVQVSYSFEKSLGFLGGPYTPIVEVSVADLRFSFITPLPGLAALVGGGATTNLSEDADSNGQADIAFPDMSVSMPAEDLSLGGRG
ncbi:MAG: pilus assembly protein [Paracoccaceae bacterium]|nr:pilus assembly protein [Paracoccaceae bacterium]